MRSAVWQQRFGGVEIEGATPRPVEISCCWLLFWRVLIHVRGYWVSDQV
jgi:hypothetical protein